MSRIEDIYGLTPVQEGMYLQALNSDSEAYQLYYLFEVNRDTDISILQQAISVLSVRHPVLRTAFAVANGTVKQVILSDRQPYFETIQVDTTYSDKELKSIVDEKSAYSFDLQKDSLMRCFFISFSDKRFYLLHTHHLIADGWSMSVLFGDLCKYYRLLEEKSNIELLKNTAKEECLSHTSFASYVNLIRAYDSNTMHQYWNKLLSGGQACTLPKAANKKEEHLIKKEVTLSPQLAEKIKAFAREYNVPVNTVFECVFSLALQKHTGKDDLIYNKVISGKSVGLPMLENTVGPMINTIPVRIQRSEKTTPLEYLQQVHEQSVSANEYGFLPLSEVYRSNSINPNDVEVLFVFGNYTSSFSSEFIPPVQLIYHKEETEYPLTVNLSPVDNEYCLQLTFDENKISKEFITSLKNSFVSIAERLVSTEAANMKEDCVLSELLKLTEEEKEAFLSETNSNSKQKVITSEYAEKKFEAPKTPTEKEICKLFGDLLGVTHIGRNDNFYDLGGTSMQIVKLLSHPPLDKLSPADFMAEPTPAAVAKRLDESVKTDYTYIAELYGSENSDKAVVLFPYAGGDASAYTALVAKAREKNSDVLLYFVDWFNEDELPAIEDELRILATKNKVCFYSHCAGCALALKLLDRLNAETQLIHGYVAGASMPPSKAFSGLNLWIRMSDEKITKLLKNAGLNLEEDEQLLPRRLEQFRRDTKTCSDYFGQKKEKTNVKLTAVISKNDPFTLNFEKTEKRWKTVVTEVYRVVLIETPSHYFQNTDTELLLGLFNELYSEEDFYA